MPVLRIGENRRYVGEKRLHGGHGVRVKPANAGSHTGIPTGVRHPPRCQQWPREVLAANDLTPVAV